MLNQFYKYLLLHQQAGVPGIGGFTIDRLPASISDDAIHPPRHRISFTAGSALTDKQFYRFLSNETGLSEVDAVRKFQDFAYQLRKDLQTHSQVELQGLGNLKKSATGEIIFEQVATTDAYFGSLTLPTLNRSTVAESSDESLEHGIEVYDENEVIKRDYWWIWALLLASVALAMIGYYYMQGELI